MPYKLSDVKTHCLNCGIGEIDGIHGHTTDCWCAEHVQMTDVTATLLKFKIAMEHEASDDDEDDDDDGGFESDAAEETEVWACTECGRGRPDDIRAVDCFCGANEFEVICVAEAVEALKEYLERNDSSHLLDDALDVIAERVRPCHESDDDCSDCDDEEEE